MGLDELQNQIIKDQRRLGELKAQENDVREVIYNDGGEVKYRNVKPQNQEEINQIKFRINDMQAQVDRIKAIQQQKSTQSTILSAEEIEHQHQQQKQEEEYKKVTFKRVKQLYKNQSAFLKFTNLINNKRPIWKDIKNYSQEELDFLVNMGMGKSTIQQKQEESTQQRYEGKLKQTDINKKVQARNDHTFDAALSSQEEFNKYWEAEQQTERRR